MRDKRIVWRVTEKQHKVMKELADWTGCTVADLLMGAYMKDILPRYSHMKTERNSEQAVG